ncbi:MAG TPA: hypothetical protein VHO68_09095 [Bacteroidales bacterium]|jgi:hypothetical protein|nr:hypothetical protein [Bacteroidales bacterium]
MKKSSLILAFQLIMIFSLKAQPVSEYLCKLDNGINLKNDHTWSQVWIQQTYLPLGASDQSPLSVNIRTLGDLIAGSSYHLENKGKEVKMKGVAPGTYNLRMSFKLSGQPGTLSFLVSNVQIKPKTKTNLAVTLYDYQVKVEESSLTNENAAFETTVMRCKASTIQDNLTGIPVFYAAGDHSKNIAPVESISKIKGKMAPGTYDLLVTIPVAGQNHRIWMENFQMKPGKNYKVSVNLNAGGIVYTGGNRNVKSLRMYPAGTASAQTGTPAPVKNLETLSYTNVNDINCCTPGTFDVLLQIGDKYEWRKNIAITTGSKTEVK